MQTVRTKQALADAVSRLLAAQPVASIRVSDICREAGVSRQAFYYNFRDKYDLIAWIFRQMAPEFDVPSIEAATIATTRFFHDQRDFYRNALWDQSQNSLDSYLKQYYVQQHRRLLLDVLGAGALPPLLETSVRVYCYGGVDLVREWLLNGTSAEPTAMAKSICAAMPAIMRDAYKI